MINYLGEQGFLIQFVDEGEKSEYNLFAEGTSIIGAWCILYIHVPVAKLLRSLQGRFKSMRLVLRHLETRHTPSTRVGQLVIEHVLGIYASKYYGVSLT